MLSKVITACIMACLLFTIPNNSSSRDLTLTKIENTTSIHPLFIATSGGKKWVLDLDKIGFDGVDPTTLNRDLFMNWFYQVVERQVNQPPRSAAYKYRAVVPHASGRMVNSKKVEEWLDDIHSYINRPVQIPLVVEKPELTTEKVRTLKQKLLATYTTWFNPWNYNRSTNIKLSAYALDHYIVKPGETFSFNEVIGKATIEKGYLSARIIVQGEYQKGVGGGICQTSSTLYNCADGAGLRIVERSSHSKEVTYVPKDRDATVSWDGHDFKFQNQLNEPILIVANVLNGRISISIYGPDTIKNQARYVPEAPSSE